MLDDFPEFPLYSVPQTWLMLSDISSFPPVIGTIYIFNDIAWSTDDLYNVMNILL